MDIHFQFSGIDYLFQRPEFILTCRDKNKLKRVFEDLEKALDDGYWAAGYLSFEAGYAFERKFNNSSESDFPLFRFGFYRVPVVSPQTPAGLGDFQLGHVRFGQTYSQYKKNIQIIRDYIASGDVYQITYCLKIFFDFDGDTWGLYQTLLKDQPVPYSVYLKDKPWTILSLSPELFIKKNGFFAVTQPMKGTWPRGRDEASDCEARHFLENDPKNQAENIMIVDLMRNDLGKVGRKIEAPGSLK